jgi:hypothetical protein
LEKIIQNKTIKFIYEIRSATNKLLPNQHSVIPFNILFLVGSSYFDGKTLSLKSLLTDTPFSEMGIRTHLKYLIDNELIYISDSNEDGRVKFVLPSDKLINILLKFDSDILSILKSHLLQIEELS